MKNKLEQAYVKHIMNEKGQGFVEYAVIFVVVIVIAMVAMRALGIDLRAYIDNARGSIFG